MPEFSSKALKHCVMRLDYLLYQGQKAVVIEDSASSGRITPRIITEVSSGRATLLQPIQ